MTQVRGSGTSPAEAVFAEDKASRRLGIPSRHSSGLLSRQRWCRALVLGL